MQIVLAFELKSLPARSDAAAASLDERATRYAVAGERLAHRPHTNTARREPNPQKEQTMALSDQLSKLAAKAKEAEDRAAAAQGKAKDELEKDVKTARDSAQSHADQMRKNAETDKGEVSDWWTDLQRKWSDHVDTVRKHVDEKKAEHDVKSAQRNAYSAEEDAAYAIDYAYGAVEEAEYAVLDAILARKDADELAESRHPPAEVRDGLSGTSRHTDEGVG